MKKICCLGVTVTVILILILCLSACNGKNPGSGIGSTDPNAQVVDIFEKMDINPLGINNYGSLEVYVHENTNESIDISEYIERVFGSWMNAPMNLISDGQWYDLFEIEVVGDNKNLSNGDEVILRVNIISALEEEGETVESALKALNIRLLKTEMKYTVSNLMDGVVIDLLGALDEYMEFTGANGNGYLSYTGLRDFVYENNGYYITPYAFYAADYGYQYTFEMIYDNERISMLTLTIRGYGDFEEGETFAVEVSETQYVSSQERNYYIVERAEYTVPKMGNYIISRDDLNDQDINDIISYAKSEMIERYGEDRCSIQGVYFATIKPSVAINETYQRTAIIVVFEYVGFFDTNILHLEICSSEFYRNKDGVLSFPGDPSYGYYHESNDPNDLSDLNEDYTYERIH